MTRLLEDRQLLLAKLEATYGTDATPDASNAMLVSSVNVRPIEGNTIDRNNITGYFGSQGSLRVGTYVAVDVEVELGGSGTKDVPVAYSLLYQACATSETVNATTDVTYNLADTAFKSLTIYYYADSTLHKITGVQGSYAFTLGTGGKPVVKFTFFGLYNTPEKAASLPNATYGSFKLPLPVNAANVSTFTFFGQALSMTKLEVDAGVQFKYRNVSDGESITTTGRESKLSLTIEEPEVDTINFFDLSVKNTTGALAYQLGTDVTDDGSIFELAIPNVEVLNVSRTYEDGIAHLNLDVNIVPTGRNLDFSFIHR